MGRRPIEREEPILMQEYITLAVSWVNRCGGSRDRRADLIVRMMGCIEVATGWCPLVKRIPGIEKVLASGISRCPEDQKPTVLLD